MHTNKLMAKWILAFIGFEFGRFPGAFLGFILGYIIDSYLLNRGNDKRKNVYNRGAAFNTTSTNNFELNLLSLAAIVIKADGHISQHELDYVRAYFVRTYGKNRANTIFRTFNSVINKREIDIIKTCSYMRMQTSYEMRLQILHFLFGIAMADGVIEQSELNTLRQITRYLNINNYDFESIKAMFMKSGSGDEAYKILEVDKDASETEIKKAYRTMVKKYHPDRLTGMDEAYIKGAREKFEKVQEAYEKIRKERGF